MATDKMKEGLQEYHTYADKAVDKPFLIPEDV